AGDLLPFFQKHRLGMVNNQLRLVDRNTNEERWIPPLAQTPMINYYTPNGTPVRLSFQMQGHLVVVNHGHMVYGLDPVERKVLWDRNLMGAGTPMQQQNLMADGNGGIQIMFGDGYLQKIGQLGPVQPTYVCMQTSQGLIALDPLKGSILWTKT